jgi:hypothetical protein
MRTVWVSIHDLGDDAREVVVAVVAPHLTQEEVEQLLSPEGGPPEDVEVKVSW